MNEIDNLATLDKAVMIAAKQSETNMPDWQLIDASLNTFYDVWADRIFVWVRMEKGKDRALIIHTLNKENIVINTHCSIIPVTG